MRFPFQILAANDFDAVAFGTNAVDYLISVPEYPAFNSKVELNEYSQAAGGAIYADRGTGGVLKSAPPVSTLRFNRQDFC